MLRSVAFVCTFVFGLFLVGAAHASPASARQAPPVQQSPAKPAAQQPQATPAPPAPAGPLAPEKYLNIQVLKDVPAEQLHDTMVYLGASIGATCTFCHVRNEAGEFVFDKDDRENKKTTREMILLTRAINAQGFKGKPTVDCATCHQGLRTPNAMPRLASVVPAGTPAPGSVAAQAGGAPVPPQRPRPPSETVDEVVDKFVTAIGGRDAIASLTARAAKGTLTNRTGQTASVTVEDTAKGQYRIGTDGANATVRAFDGAVGWLQAADKVRELEGVEAAPLALTADLALAIQIKDHYQGLAVRAYDRIDGRDVVAMQGRASANVAETFYFDKASGLLVRRTIRLATPLGRLPLQIDYADYKAVGRVTLPFGIKITDWESVTDLKFSEIVLNPKIDSARFAKPGPGTGQKY